MFANPAHLQNKGHHPLQDFSKITKSDLQKLFNALPPKHSAGVDGLTNKIIKYCQEELLEPLLHNIIN